MAYRDNILADSPIWYLEFEQATGQFTNTGTAGGTTASVGANVTRGAGKYGDAINLTKGTSTSYVAFSAGNAWLSARVFTIEAWFKTTNTTTSNTLSQYNAAQYYVLQTTGAGNVNFQLAGTGGSAQNITGATVVNDGAWHHVAIVVNGASDTKMYVDGVLDASTTTALGTFSATANVDIGSASTSGTFAGSVDEFALYDTALSAARVQTHYSNSVSVTVDVTTATASVQAHDATIESNLQTAVLNPSADTTYDPDTTTNRGAETSLRATTYNGGTPSNKPLVKMDLSGVALNSTVNSAKVRLYVSSFAPSMNFSIGRVTSAWSEATAPGNPTTTGNRAITGPTGAGWWEIDITAEVQAWANGATNNGFAIWATSDTGRFLLIDSREGANKPVLKAFYGAPAVAATVDVAAATLSVQAHDVAVGISAAYEAATATMSATAHDAEAMGSANVDLAAAALTVQAHDATADSIVTPNVTVELEPATFSVAAQEADVSAPVVVDLEAVSFTTEAYDASVETSQGAHVDLEAATFSITHKQLTDVNGEPIVATEDEDKFFVEVRRLFAQNRPNTAYLGAGAWFRMQEQSGTDAIDRTGRWTGGTYDGVGIGLNGGPSGRRYVHFDGSAMFSQNDGYLGTDSELYDYNGTLHFAIRTDKQNQFVMRMDDIRKGVIFDTDTPARDIYLADGKLQIRVWEDPNTFDGIDQLAVKHTYTGFTNIADGEWHQVVMASSSLQTGKVDIYIDGKLEMRRMTHGFSFPDFIGLRPGGGGTVGSTSAYQTMPFSEGFVGDMAEVAYFDGQHINQDQTLRLYDTLFGFDPVYLEAASLSMAAHEPVVKGNAKRVLTLNFSPLTTTLALPGAPKEFAFGGLAYGGSNVTSGVQVGGYQVFQVSAWTPGNGLSYLDAITDEMRLIDLDVDVNLEDYDIINVINYPQKSSDWDVFSMLDRQVLFGGLSGRGQAEKVVRQIHQYVVEGGGLFLTDPSFAVALGMIDDVDYVPLMREGDQTLGYDDGASPAGRDLQAAKINPWGDNPNSAITTIWQPRTPAGPKAGIDYFRHAEYYDDEHANNKQRVRALVEGLTDIPGNILVDSIAFWGHQGNGEMHAEKYAERPEGLAIGDEFTLMGTPHSGRGGGFGGIEATGAPVGPWSRYYGMPATPIANVKAGTVVTSLASKTWEDDQQQDNPYRDYAVSVVVQPGDTLGGQVVQGRIFMNFTESFADMAPTLQHGIKDVIPPNEAISVEDYKETEESREWAWSMWRGTWSGNQSSSGGNSTVTIGLDGSIKIGNSGGDLVGITYSNRWPQVGVPLPTMHYRGLKWLADSADRSGNATVGVATAAMTISAQESSVEASSTAVVELAPARFTAQAESLSDQTYADAVVLLTAPGTFTVKAESFAEIVELDAARLTLRAHDDFDSTYQDADLVVMRLPGSNVILYMEER